MTPSERRPEADPSPDAVAEDASQPAPSETAPRRSRTPIVAVAAAVLLLVVIGAALAFRGPAARVVDDVVGVLTGSSGPAYSHPAARAVDDVLRIRSRLVTDPAAYAPFVASSEIATALAEDSAAKKGSGGRPTPDWARPYVSKVASSSADVVVVWKRSAEETGWPFANLFKLTLSEDRWRLADASSLAETAVPVPLGEE